MKNKTIYFAHPFERMDTKREEMIEKILEGRGYEVINPFEREKKLNIKYGVSYYYENPTKPFAWDVVDGCYEMVKTCDELFAWIPKGDNAVGTTWEIRLAWDYGKKIMALANKPHPFLWRFVNKMYVGYYNFMNDKPFYIKS